MGNLNSTVDGCSSEEYYRLCEDLDKKNSKLELLNVENKGYRNSIKDLEKRIIYIENENNILKDKNNILEEQKKKLNNEIINYKEKNNNDLKENIILTLKNNDLNIENENLKNQINQNELDIYNYDLNYKYIKFILKQQNKLNLKLENNLTKQYKINSSYLKESIFINILNNYLHYTNKKQKEQILDLIEYNSKLTKEIDMLTINNNSKIKNVFNYYKKNQEIVIKNIMLEDNTLMPDFFEKKIINNTYNKLLSKLMKSLNQ
tara:strand:+ start:904 stop:1689 length:786 start_codon:yes stop_codon:yes gene_type:complete